MKLRDVQRDSTRVPAAGGWGGGVSDGIQEPVGLLKACVGVLSLRERLSSPPSSGSRLAGTVRRAAEVILTSVLLRVSVQAVLFDIITKNYDKIKKPRGDGKALIY